VTFPSEDSNYLSRPSLYPNSCENCVLLWKLLQCKWSRQDDNEWSRRYTTPPMYSNSRSTVWLLGCRSLTGWPMRWNCETRLHQSERRISKLPPRRCNLDFACTPTIFGRMILGTLCSRCLLWDDVGGARIWLLNYKADVVHPCGINSLCSIARCRKH
jgi:hypothetical protein